MLIKVLKDISQFVAGDKTILKEVLHPKNDALDINYSLAHAIVLPSEQSLPHTLHERSEVYYILKGQGEMHINENTKIVNAGDTVFIPAGAEQWIKNTKKEDLEFLAIVSPPWTDESEEIF